MLANHGLMGLLLNNIETVNILAAALTVVALDQMVEISLLGALLEIGASEKDIRSVTAGTNNARPNLILTKHASISTARPIWR